MLSPSVRIPILSADKMLLKIFSAFLVLPSTTIAIPTTTGKYPSKDALFSSSIREKLAGPPAGWVRDESAKVDKETSVLSLRIHLVHQDMDKFHDLAMNVWNNHVS
jgi:tripeptidyl-peptidase-1